MAFKRTTTGPRGHGLLTLHREDVRKIIEEYPLVASVEEMCIIRGCDVEYINEDVKEYAKKQIDHNLMKTKMRLRDQLLEQGKKGNEGNIKALVTIYQLIATDDELRRLGTPNLGKKELGGKKSEITIKSADPDILNKLSDL